MTKDLPDNAGHFGIFGGKYVPETLMSALQELEQEYDKAYMIRQGRRTMCKFGTFLGVVLGLLILSVPALAATRTWDGGGVDNNWSTCPNHQFMRPHI